MFKSIEMPTEGYWEKSIENFAVFEWACNENHWNAAASRYYYAFLLAAKEYLLVAGIKTPENLHNILHFNLHEDVGSSLDNGGLDVEKFFYEAFELRCVGDYEDTPVEKHQLDIIQNDGKRVIEMLRKKIEVKKHHE